MRATQFVFLLSNTENKIKYGGRNHYRVCMTSFELGVERKILFFTFFFIFHRYRFCITSVIRPCELTMFFWKKKSYNFILFRWSNWYFQFWKEASDGIKVVKNSPFSVPPHWLMEPMDTSVERNRHVALHCQAQGVPTPVIVWKKAIGKFFSQVTLTLASKLAKNS